MTRAVISDLGKVVLWFDNTAFYRKMAVWSPFSAERIGEIARRTPEFVELFDLGRLTPREFHERLLAKLEARVGFDEFMAAYVDVFSVNVPVLDILRRLKIAYRLVLVSNVDPVRFAFIRHSFPETMIFDDYVLSYELGMMKPDERVYRTALEKAGAGPSECVFIDDLEVNIAGARALGMPAVLYRPETDLEQELRQLGLSF